MTKICCMRSCCSGVKHGGATAGVRHHSSTVNFSALYLAAAVAVVSGVQELLEAQTVIAITV
jgi:hypothetical protein